MRKGPILAALDVGSEAIKCFIFDLEGRVFSSAAKKFERSWIGTNFDARRAWKLLCDVIREAVKTVDVLKEEILGVSSTALREQVIFMDKNDEEISFPPDIELFIEGEMIEKLYRGF